MWKHFPTSKLVESSIVLDTYKWGTYLFNAFHISAKKESY